MKQYITVTIISRNELDLKLNINAKKGWEFKAYIPPEGNSLAMLLLERNDPKTVVIEP